MIETCPRCPSYNSSMFRLPIEIILKALQTGSVSLRREFAWGSNYTFLVDVIGNNETAPFSLKAVYKPIRGETPLWDFPAESLAHREVAAYLVSEALGWILVPPTAYRQEGPLGPGSIQLFINHDPEYHYFNFGLADRKRLRPIVLFDFLVNNADRKGGHLLLDYDNHIWSIDHGICFHEEDKLRTVLWDFTGKKVPVNLRTDIRGIYEKLSEPSGLVNDLGAHLTRCEIVALKTRAAWLCKLTYFPNPPSDRRPYPWPPL